MATDRVFSEHIEQLEWLAQMSSVLMRRGSAPPRP
jgi:hypothetical protein